VGCLARKNHLKAAAMDEIADHCGFGSADVLSRAFTRVLRLTPGEYRSRFRSSGIGK
jgi:transcriptional regulator GlxA family with amidase domain